jgi:hypothetical protein
MSIQEKKMKKVRNSLLLMTLHNDLIWDQTDARIQNITQGKYASFEYVCAAHTSLSDECFADDQALRVGR